MRLPEPFASDPVEELRDPEAERELAAVDAALAGRHADPDLDDLTAIARELRLERATPDPAFSQRLDRWAAEGFPRGRSPEPAGATAWERLPRRLASTPPRRLLAPVGAAATVVVVIGVAIAGSGDLGRNGDGDAASSGGGVAVQAEPAGGGRSAKALEDSAQAEGGGAARATDEGLDRLGFSRDARGANFLSAGIAKSAADVPIGQRKIAQRVDLVLATAPSEFRDAADAVLQVIGAHRGFVTESSVSGGDPGFKGSELGRAHFEMKVPAGELDATLTELSDLGHVVSRTDGSKDITSAFVSVKKDIAAYVETRQNLLQQLEDAVTIEEQESIKRRLQIVEEQLNAARHQLDDLKQRVHLVPLSVSINADPAVGGKDEVGGWSIGDAFDDAGRVLEVAAGVLIVTAAVLGPVAVIALLAWLAARELARRRREAALD